MASLKSLYRPFRGSQPQLVDLDFCEEVCHVYEKDMGLECPKFIKFIEHALNKGFKVRMYMAQTTRSKYITLSSYRGKQSRHFMVRFSNHKPNKQREENGDCDFFVGVTHLGVTTTGEAWNAAVAYFKAENMLPKGFSDA